MTICFVLPHPADGPTGGYKVVYEYANRFATDGINVHIVYSGSIFWAKKPLRFKLSNCVRYAQQILRGYSGRKWFPLNRHVREHLTLSMNYRHVPKADVYVATSPYTAWYINEYPIESKRKFYLIQGKEDWGPGLRGILTETYHAPLHKIAVSRWLQRMLREEYGEESVLIPNGFDFNKFQLTTPIETRDKYTVSMLYHTQKLKRSADAFSALSMVKMVYPELRVNIFGVPNPPDLPDWYHYHQQPDVETHNHINNESAIFIATSESEGWGLPVGEAMICGQAVCCTDNAGYREMAIDGKTALLSPVGDTTALAKNMIRLIKDETLRHRIAKEGNRSIQQFTWEKSYQQLKNLFNEIIA